ncbi:MAG TPA: MFS transporter [Scandinavium sp.]|jgi:MHS family proline/betaine transporter-like MFS transporter
MTNASPHYVSRRSILVAALSTIVEWYDFTLYLYFSAVLSRVFFGDSAQAMMLTLSVFAVTYLLRPVGAIFFARIGDRYGRRRMLLLSMAMMTGAMLLTALLPTWHQAGSVASVSIMLLRALMTFSVGGEYNGVVAYLLEGTPPQHRGQMASLASAASEVGALLAVGISALTVSLLSEASLEAWGWRIPFVVGFVLAGSLWAARSALEESPDFELHRRPGIPLSLRTTLSRYRLAIGRSFAVSALGSVTYYIGITYVPTYLVSMGICSDKDALVLSTVAALCVVLITPVVGYLSDRVGRKPVLACCALVAVALPVILFPLMAGGAYAESLVGAVLLACLAGSVSAVGASATAEQFPVEGRLTGLALGTTAATAIFGGLAPWIAQRVITSTGNPIVPGLIIALVALAVLPVFLRMPETAPKKERRIAWSPGLPAVVVSSPVRQQGLRQA